MEGPTEHIDTLIAKFLAGEALPDEAMELMEWREKSPANESYFARCEKLYDALGGQNQPVSFNTNKAWARLDEKISESAAKIIPFYRSVAFLRIAASLLLLVSLAFVARFVLWGDSQAPLQLAAGKTGAEQKLPDGSKVFMNRNAEITYEVQKGQRRVKLKGEAFFEVAHNEEEPFVVAVDEVLIKDIGTAFNVKALPGSNRVEVLVQEGEVQFYTENAEGLRLVKGEKALYDKNTLSFEKLSETINENTGSYRTRQFHFSNARLIDVVNSVNAVYDSDLRLASPALDNCRLSVEFDNENLEVIISIIAETLDLEVEHSKQTVTLKGNACPG